MVKILDQIGSLKSQVRLWKMNGDRLAFVPTMGALHQGHLSLVETAKSHAERVMVSIFVNPLQFAPHEDFDKYPRTLSEDLEKLEKLGVDAVFTPTTQVLYPHAQAAHIKVEAPEMSKILCGVSRPHFFAGVATVVSKLFHIVEPDFAFFGLKDYQQFVVIKQLISDLHFPLEAVGVPTVREADGLALSSRNVYLSDEERQKAPELHKMLHAIKQAILAGERDFERLSEHAKQTLQAHGFAPDYVEIREAEFLRAPTATDPAWVALVAAWLGKTRLIDNIRIDLQN